MNFYFILWNCCLLINVAHRAHCFVITDDDKDMKDKTNYLSSVTLSCSSLEEKRDFLKKVKACNCHLSDSTFFSMPMPMCIFLIFLGYN